MRSLDRNASDCNVCICLLKPSEGGPGTQMVWYERVGGLMQEIRFRSNHIYHGVCRELMGLTGSLVYLSK